jgi:hypothetical protein
MGAFTLWNAVARLAVVRARYSSNSSMFAKRGDPWVSRREGERLFGRNLETENPELDQFTRARKAEPKPKFIDPKPERRTEADFARQKANALRAMHRDMNGASRHIVKMDAAPRLFKPCDGCRMAKCIAAGSCKGGRR